MKPVSQMTLPKLKPLPARREDYKTLAEVRMQEKWKAHFLARIKASGPLFHRWAWAWGCDTGIILSVERLEDGMPWKFPQDKEAMELAGATIRANAEFGIMGREQWAQYNEAHEVDDLNY